MSYIIDTRSWTHRTASSDIYVHSVMIDVGCAPMSCPNHMQTLCRTMNMECRPSRDIQQSEQRTEAGYGSSILLVRKTQAGGEEEIMTLILSVQAA